MRADNIRTDSELRSQIPIKGDALSASKGSEDIADMVLAAAAELEEEFNDIFLDILAQGKSGKRKSRREN